MDFDRNFVERETNGAASDKEDGSSDESSEPENSDEQVE